uniref:Dynein heavy chain n=1 Tax=Denticeps clupeoides TaxID=299321 RepID=A0AAY3ZXU8_9TELE
IKNEDADRLILEVGVEKDKVDHEKAVANEEEQKVANINLVVQRKAKDCEEDLAKAEPALIAAQEALNTLNKNNLTELKSFGSPVAAVTNVTAAVMVLMAPGGKVPKDRSWKSAKAMMAKVDSFLDSLPYLDDAEFKPELVASKSNAAAGLCSWVINIVKYYEVYCEVEPKRKALKQANSDLASAQEKLAHIKAKVNVSEFQPHLPSAEQCRHACNSFTLTLITVESFLYRQLLNENLKMLCGDVLLITAFVSYLGYFTKHYRQQLMEQMTEELDPLTMLTDDAVMAAWQNEGLPADRMSTENATILSSCERWPLMVDPQLQGIKWIKTKYGDQLRISIEKAVAAGEVVLIENLEETVDPVLGPLLGRETIKKGRYEALKTSFL